MIYILTFIVLVLIIFNLKNQKLHPPCIKNFNFQIKINLDDIDNDVKLWCKPNSKNVHFYSQGTTSGDGLLGVISNNGIYEHIKNNMKYKAKISFITDKKITVTVHFLKNEYE